MPSTADPGWWKRPRIFVLPVLPPELWIEIFEFATYVPGALQSQSYNPFETVVPLPQLEELRSLKIAYRTKRSLVLVCKRWRDLALPILYRVVLADGTKALLYLYRTLTSDLATSLRTHVRRLICRVETAEKLLASDPLPDVIKAIPSLVIFNLWLTNGTSYSMPDDVLLAVASQGKSIRVLDWTPSLRDEYDLTGWRQMLSSLPNLRILRYGFGGMSPSTASAPPIRLPNLTYSTWDTFGRHGRLTPEDDLTGLRALEFISTSALVPPHLGRNITSLSMPVVPQNANEVIARVLSALPNVTHLVLWSLVWAIIPHALSLPKKVQKLGLCWWSGQRDNNEDYAGLFENIFSIHAPDLETVRFVGWDEWGALSRRSPQVLSRFRELAPSRTFRVEDREGRLLVDLWGLS
ncbi:hypothetical protein GLOTRDRAFT_137399 [Gloeophyllum trabeum ATCC 11539]|uniref:Uncharacterized protein n=1 Tax=Gloeophyllum trabeum (strain ATCC 11539 / FP-39264 / Madison 617) TaxID=670483 RepID=S7RQR8_GLOTA|nr:uncharacterized protein GLOTRDRAFT_137399 [Gloeophyllum trabeum ATCC 11539]EPQ56920.1 hypothetical protein GLOTRDRAFT_137399 [Gloeophyllum trabeum ATCC 11539]